MSFIVDLAENNLKESVLLAIEEINNKDLWNKNKCLKMSPS